MTDPTPQPPPQDLTSEQLMERRPSSHSGSFRAYGGSQAMTTQSIISNTWMDADEVSPASSVANKAYYRYEERIENCGYFDADGDYFYRSETNRCRVVLFDFPVKAETRCGVWISDRLGMRKWINSSWNKRYAHPTKEEAWTSFVARKKRQHRFLYARLAAIESLLEMPLPTDEEFASHLPHQTARTAYAPSAPPSKTPSALKGAGATPRRPPPMPSNVPLTPEAAAVVAAFDAVMDRAGVFEGATDALAAALRELAAVATVKTTAGGYVLSADIGAIADSIENAITYTPVEAPTDA